MIDSNISRWKGFRMCKKLKEIAGLTPDDILNKYWNAKRNVCPIDISTILFKMGIRVQSYDFTKLDKNSNNRILGAMIANDNDLALLYSQGETKNRNRFTLAHELAHCCKAHLDDQKMPYIEYRHDGVVTDQHEIEANIFAGELLIPTTELRKVLSIEYPNSFPCVTRLSEIFAVSVNVVKGRLNYLKIPYIDEYNHKILAWSN